MHAKNEEHLREEMRQNLHTQLLKIFFQKEKKNPKYLANKPHKLNQKRKINRLFTRSKIETRRGNIDDEEERTEVSK